MIGFKTIFQDLKRILFESIHEQIFEKIEISKFIKIQMIRYVLGYFLFLKFLITATP